MKFNVRSRKNARPGAKYMHACLRPSGHNINTFNYSRSTCMLSDSS